jgi:predicted nucleic acid-binding protein
VKEINNQRILVDTDILIDHLRGSINISNLIDSSSGNTPFISVISIAEIYSFLFAQEYQAVDELINMMTVINIDSLIAKTAGKYRMTYIKSHMLTVPDALIAATAKINRAALITKNMRHFPMDDITKIRPY